MFYSIIKLLAYNVLNFFNKQNLRQLKLLKSTNNTIHILGNGPSIKNQIGNLVSNSNECEFIVVNNFASSEYYQLLKPQYYLIVDPGYWSNDVSDDLKEDRKLFDIIKSETNWQLNIIVPYVAFKYINLVFSKYPNIKIFFYNHTIIPYELNQNLIGKLYLNMLCSPRLQNVISASIFCSIVLGYKKISLYGVDHSWLNDILVDNENRVCWRENHFYSVAQFRPHIKSNGHVYKLHELLFDYGQVFKSYHNLREFADNCNCKIINHTEGSYIDAFIKEV
jgi:hypothetical protein